MILITGANGNVGREVVKQALALGLQIRATFQSPATAAQAPAGLEGVIMDFAEARDDSSSTGRSGKDSFDRTAGSGTIRTSRQISSKRSEHCGGKTHCQAFRFRWSGVDVYERTSRVGGEYRSFRRITIPRSCVLTVSRENYVNCDADTIRSQSVFYGCQGEGAVSVIDIRDIAAVAVIVLTATEHERKSYTLTEKILTNQQVAEKISGVAGRTIKYVDLPPAEFKKGILSTGASEWTANALVTPNVSIAREKRV